MAIDGLQGPSEVLIIADETASPKYCALDLVAQAEHDPSASAILITTSHQLADEVAREIEQLLKGLERQAIATESLENRGMIVVVSTVDEAIELANLYAPEHLALMVDRAGLAVHQPWGRLDDAPKGRGDALMSQAHAKNGRGLVEFADQLQ